jgi:glutathione S-transferase
VALWALRWDAWGVLRLWQFPFSTNVERVALALAHKGLDAEPVVIDPADRSGVRARSGQDLVPVLEDGDTVISGSLEIVAHLEHRAPDPPLLPADRARREQVLVLCDWFDRVWKIAPNRLADAVAAGRDPAEPELVAWAAELRGSLDRFESLLAGNTYLSGDHFGLADVAVFPFLRYGVGLQDEDVDLFHRILAEHLLLEPRHAGLGNWIRRVDGLPRAGLAVTTPLETAPPES